MATRTKTRRTEKTIKPAPARRAATRAPMHLRQRAEWLLARKIEFIPSPLFDDRKSIAEILAGPSTPTLSRPDVTARRPSGLAPYLSNLYDTALLSGDDEARLFRKMNLLKYRASELRTDLDADHPRVELMNRIEADLSEADEIKKLLIRANLRLVVSVARKFVESATNLAELISDGNISMMRAVEKFDADRGFKFSTYATYAVRRNFFRTIIQARKDRQRYVSGDEALVQLSSASQNDQQLTESQYVQLKGWLGKLLTNLNPREQVIISLRFGLQANSEPQTLQDIAKGMGVCKERIRQLQTRAMTKLQKAAEACKAEVGEML